MGPHLSAQAAMVLLPLPSTLFGVTLDPLVPRQWPGPSSVNPCCAGAGSAAALPWLQHRTPYREVPSGVGSTSPYLTWTLPQRVLPPARPIPACHTGCSSSAHPVPQVTSFSQLQCTALTGTCGGTCCCCSGVGRGFGEAGTAAADATGVRDGTRIWLAGQPSCSHTCLSPVQQQVGLLWTAPW